MIDGLAEVRAVVNRIVIDYFGSDLVEDLADGIQVVTIGQAQVEVSVVDSTARFPVIVVNGVVARGITLDHLFGVKLLDAWQGTIGSWRYINISDDVADLAFGTKVLAAGFGTSDITYTVTTVGRHVTRVGDRVRNALAGSNAQAVATSEDVSNEVEDTQADGSHSADGLTAASQAGPNAGRSDYIPQTDYAVHCEILANFSAIYGQPESSNQELTRSLAEHNIDFSITRAAAYQERTNSKDVRQVDMERVADSVRTLATLLGFEAADYFVFDGWDDFHHHMKMLGPESFFFHLNQG